MDGRRFLESLKYVLFACPKAADNENLARVIFTDNRIIAGDSHRWHIAHLGSDVDMPPRVVTRASVEKLKKALAGIVPPLKSEDRVSVEVDGLVVEIRDGDEPITRTLEPFDSGVWPSNWEPPVPADASLLEGVPSHLDSKHVRQASTWKDSVSVWRGEGNLVRVDVMLGEERLATAVLLEAGHTVEVDRDPRQAKMFASNTKPLADAGAVFRRGMQKIADESGGRISVAVNGKTIAHIEPKVTIAGDKGEPYVVAVRAANGGQFHYVEGALLEESTSEVFEREVKQLAPGECVKLFGPDRKVSLRSVDGPPVTAPAPTKKGAKKGSGKKNGAAQAEDGAE